MEIDACVRRGQTHWYSYSFALRPDKFHSVPLDLAAGKVAVEHLAEAGSVIKAILG
jgi:hypothetical protein